MPEVPSPDWLSWALWAQNSAAVRDLLITIAALAGIPFVVWREWLHHRQTLAALQQAEIARQQAATSQLRHDAQVEADRERRITDNFTRAADLLGSDKLASRLGAIYSFERIAGESPTDHWPIIETLTAYVREQAPWLPPLTTEENKEEENGEEEEVLPRPLATDIQAILTVIGRRRRDYEGKGQRLDLTRTDLRNADLMDAQLEWAFLLHAHLEWAGLMDVHLERAWLEGAHLEWAYLQGAHLEGADFQGAHLEGADLRGTDLTQEQFDSAISDERTKVPPHIKRPAQPGTPAGEKAAHVQHELAAAPD